jgi:hypothetical protein
MTHTCCTTHKSTGGRIPVGQLAPRDTPRQEFPQEGPQYAPQEQESYKVKPEEPQVEDP